MDYEVARIMSDPDWYEKYHSYIRLQGRTAYIKEMLADNQWVLKRWRFSHYIATVPILSGKWKEAD